MSGGIIISIIAGRDLYPHDSGGTSDPYVNIRIGTKKYDKTKIISNTLNPSFNETFAIPMSKLSEDSEINLIMWDNDPIGKDFMGQLSYRVSSIMKHEVSGWQTLRKRKEKDKVSGELNITIKYFGDKLEDAFKKTEAEVKAAPAENKDAKQPEKTTKDKDKKPKKQPSKSKLKSSSKTTTDAEVAELRKLLKDVTQEHSVAFTRAQENEDKLKKRDEFVSKLQKDYDALKKENEKLSKQQAEKSKEEKHVEKQAAPPVDTSEVDELKEEVEALQEALSRNTAALEEQSNTLHAKDEELQRTNTSLTEKDKVLSELREQLKKAEANASAQAPAEAPVAGDQDKITKELSALFDADFAEYYGADDSLSALEKAKKVKQHLESALAEAKRASSSTPVAPAPSKAVAESTSAPAGMSSYAISFVSFVAAFTATSIGVAASGMVDPSNTLITALVVSVPSVLTGFGVLASQSIHLAYTKKPKQE